MVTASQQPQKSQPPARQLRLLANLAPGATVVFGLLTVWLVVTALQSLAQPMGSGVVASLVLGLAAAAVAGLVTYRLAVEVPRVLRGWHTALLDRARVLRDE
jgi:branched-subunit amino acid ABC-type transport system permease component